MNMTVTQLVDCMKEFFHSKCYLWAFDRNLIVSDSRAGYARYAISLKDSIGFRFRKRSESDDIIYALFTYDDGEGKTLFAYEGDRGAITMYEYPPALEDIISKEDIENFAIHIAKTFCVDCNLILKRKTNVTMANVVNIIKNSFEGVINTSRGIEVSVRYQGHDEARQIEDVDNYDYYDDTYLSEIQFSLNGNSTVYCSITKIWNSYNVQSYTLKGNINPFFTTELSDVKLTIDRYGTIIFKADGVHPKDGWQTSVLDKLRTEFGSKHTKEESNNDGTSQNNDPSKEKDATTENETLDEKFKNRISYIMDHVLDLLINETKKVLNKNVVMVNCYESSNVKPSCLLGFKGVDISTFVKFICDCGSWNVRKSTALSGNDKVTYCITWPGSGTLPSIIITRNGCKFGGGDRPRNHLMDSALPKIADLCKTFNDDTPENKDADKLVLNEGATVSDVIGSNVINKHSDHAFVFHGRPVNLTDCVAAPSRYGLIDPKTKQINEVAHLIYRAFVFAIDEIAKEDNVPISHIPAIQESTLEWLFAYKNHDGDICLACTKNGDLDHYELWYRDPKGIKHVFMRLVVGNHGHITVYEGDRDAVTHVSARAKVKVKALVDEYNNLKDFCKTIKSIAENHVFEYNKEEIKMEVKKDRTCACACKPIQDQIKDVIFDDPATTVLWTDGTKTTVKRMTTKYQTVITKDGGKEVPVERVPFDAEAALAAAIMNKMFGTHSKYAKFVKGYVVESENRKAAKKKKAAKKETAKKKKDSPCTEEKVTVSKKKTTTKKKEK